MIVTAMFYAGYIDFVWDIFVLDSIIFLEQTLLANLYSKKKRELSSAADGFIIPGWLAKRKFTVDFSYDKVVTPKHLLCSN